MKKLLLFLLIPVAGIGQGKTTTVLPTDIYQEYNLHGGLPGTTSPVRINMYCGTPKSAMLISYARERVIMDSVVTGNHPLIIIDECEKNYSIMKNLSTALIESINVTKSSAAIEKYGTKAQYGVIEITMKKNASYAVTKAEITKPVPIQ